MWGVVALLTALWLWIMIDMFHSCIEEPQWYGPFSWENENIRFVVLFGLGPLGIAAMTVCMAFGTYGKVIIQDDCFEYHAIFRRPKKVYYSEFNYYGIEYDIRQKAGKVWYIYFRKEKKPEKYLHKDEIGFPAKPLIKFTYR